MKPTWVVVPVVFLAAATGWTETPQASPLEVHGLFAAGVEYGAPYKLAGSLRHDTFFTRNGPGTDRTFLLQPIGSVGLGGAKAGLGVGVLGGMGLLTGRVALARTFEHPLGLDPNRTWVGGELEWSWAHLVSLQAGVLSPLGGGDPAFTWAVGIGVPLIDLDDLPCPGCH